MIAAEIDQESTEQTTAGGSAVRLMEDVVVLAELHWQLFLSDVKQYMSKIVAVAAIAATAVVLLLAAIFFGLAAIAMKLISEGMSPAESCGLVALATMIAAASLLVWSWSRMHGLSGAFGRSRGSRTEHFVVQRGNRRKKGRFESGMTEYEDFPVPRVSSYSTKQVIFQYISKKGLKSWLLPP